MVTHARWALSRRERLGTGGSRGAGGTSNTVGQLAPGSVPWARGALLPELRHHAGEGHREQQVASRSENRTPAARWRISAVANPTSLGSRSDEIRRKEHAEAEQTPTG